MQHISASNNTLFLITVDAYQFLFPYNWHCEFLWVYRLSGTGCLCSSTVLVSFLQIKEQLAVRHSFIKQAISTAFLGTLFFSCTEEKR